MSSQTEQAPSQLPGAASTAPPVQAAAAPQGTRLLFIDNLRIVRPASSFPSALESSGEVGEKLGRQCLHRLPDPCPGASRFCLCFPRGGAVSSAQIWHRGAHHAPTLLPDQQLDPQDSFGQQDIVKDQVCSSSPYELSTVPDHRSPKPG